MTRIVSTTPREIAASLAGPSMWEGLPLPLGATLGQEAHLRERSKRSDWNPEVSVRANFTAANGIRLDLHGRADFVRRTPVVLEVLELKSVCFAPGILETTPAPPDSFVIQTIIYAYLLWREGSVELPEQVRPSLLLIDPFDDRQREFPLTWTPHEVESLLDRFATQQQRIRFEIATDRKHRRSLSSQLIWPLPSIRLSQSEMSLALETAFTEGSDLLLQAPPGSGKTLGLLVPALQRSLSHGWQLFYATAKGSGRSPVLSAIQQIRQIIPGLRTLFLASREEICSATSDCGNYEGCLGTEETKIDRQMLEQLFKEGTVTTRELIQWSEEHDLCPFRVSRAAVEIADMVVGDCNFVFDPQATLAQFRDDGPLAWMLLIDEAHNLPDRAREMFSVQLALEEVNARIERFEAELWRCDDPEVSDNLYSTYLRLRSTIESACADATPGEPELIDPDVALWRLLRDDFGRAASLFMANAGRLDHEVAADLRRTYHDFERFAELIEADAERFIYYAESSPPSIGIKCIEVEEGLARQMSRFKHVVAFSGTITPLEQHTLMLGLTSRPCLTSQIDEPTDQEDRLLVLHAPGIETRLLSRPASAKKVARLIGDFSRLAPGKTLAIFPSFDYVDMIAPLLLERRVEILTQSRGMDAPERRHFMGEFRGSKGGTVALVVAGGQFTEAEDYPDDDCVGCVLVGPFLPPTDVWKEALREYWDRRGEDGWAMAYLYPAIRKVVQAAGRILRLDSDRGVLLLCDDRYVQEPILPLLPVTWQRMLSRQSDPWQAAEEEFWVQSSQL